MMPTFRDWLMEQSGRSDPIGDLAEDAAGDNDFPKSENLTAYQRYLATCGACRPALDALREAWAEWGGEIPDDDDDEETD